MKIKTTSSSQKIDSTRFLHIGQPKEGLLTPMSFRADNSQDNQEGGWLKCLKCNNQFLSRNRFTNRICKKCNRDNKSLRLPRVFRSPAVGGDIGVSEDL